jgi:hypothetical protein
MCYNSLMYTIICAVCSRPFFIPANRLQTAKFCSNACYRLRNPEHTLQCERCGKTFSVVASRKTKVKYCSLACRDFRELIPCVICGTGVLRSRSEMKTRKDVYCSDECGKEYARRFRSGKNHPRYINSLSLPDFTTEQKEMILGTTLGDGCLLLNSNGNAHLQVAHSVKQRDYLDYKHALLIPFASRITMHRRLDTRYNRIYEMHRFYTACHPWLTELRLMLYPGGVKHLPSNLAELLTPRVLAFWFMDDGHCSRPGNTFLLCTVCFPRDEVEMAAEVISCLGLKAWEKQGRITISAHSKHAFVDLIGGFVPPSMRYKLGPVANGS